MIEKDCEKKPLRDVVGLPIGVPGDDGQLIKTLTLLPWGWKEEKAIAKAKEDKAGELTLAEVITETLKLLIGKWGPYDFQNLDGPTKELHLRNSFFADVFTAYVKLRVEAMGDILVLPFECPKCKNEFKFEADLRELEIQVLPEEIVRVENVVRRYHVAPPMRIGEAVCGHVDIRPMRWEAPFSAPGDLLGTADPRFLELCFLDGVVGAEGIESHGGAIMIEERLETLRKIDIERLSGLVDKTALGPDLTTELKCPKCRYEFVALGDWTYDHFFGSSSLPNVN